MPSSCFASLAVAWSSQFVALRLHPLSHNREQVGPIFSLFERELSEMDNESIVLLTRMSVDFGSTKVGGEIRLGGRKAETLTTRS